MLMQLWQFVDQLFGELVGLALYALIFGFIINSFVGGRR